MKKINPKLITLKHMIGEVTVKNFFYQTLSYLGQALNIRKQKRFIMIVAVYRFRKHVTAEIFYWI